MQRKIRDPSPLAAAISAQYGLQRMADFWQGSIPTLHLLRGDSAHLYEQLASFSAQRPVVLLLPCHAREVGSPALLHILSELRRASWLQHVVIGLDQAKEADCLALRHQASGLPAQVLWLDGPDWLEARKSLRRTGIPLPDSGKGRNVWLCLGWILQHSSAEIIALHDCDIADYQVDLLARLVFPIAHPDFGFRFCKGYYPRFTSQLHGRLTRRLVAPLLRALVLEGGESERGTLLQHFRYPLAGETAFDRAVAASLSIPSGWALEIGVLGAILRKLPRENLCQSGLVPAYDHRHHPLVASSTAPSLVPAAMEIAATLIEMLAGSAIPAHNLQSRFLHESANLDRCYAADAAINGLEFDAAGEAEATRLFADCIARAGAFARASVLLPAWRELDVPLPVG